MATKLGKSAYPSNSGPNDFECFGPPATKDGEFDNVKICDMGCFNQSGVDSNKYYHGAIVKHKTTGQWYVYFEWGRTGATNPQFQFVQCSSEQEAQREFADQLHAKNDKRGQWVVHSTLGRILQAKPGKDCYLVRPQATRSTGLPDARTIKFNEGATKVASDSKKKTAASKPSSNVDPQTLSLMRDLNVGTIKYTKGSMVSDTLPTQSAIDEGRDILSAALKRVSIVGDDTNSQVNDAELKNLTSLIYGRIPKKKDRNAPAHTWILSKDTVASWQQDLDAYESALYASGQIEDDAQQNDPFGGMKIKMEWLSPQSKMGEFIHSWMPKATKNVHSYIGNMKIRNVWRVDREGDENKLSLAQDRILKSSWTTKERPLHQPTSRTDLDRAMAKKYVESHTAMLFHGTRSVNVSGILREALRLPRQLVGVVITGAMFGPGLYWADDWKKSAGYTSLSSSIYASGGGSISGRGAFMFVADVALGNPYVAPGPKGFTAPPSGYHCVFGKAKVSQVQNNEWIIFNSDQNKLRYLVEFTT